MDKTTRIYPDMGTRVRRFLTETKAGATALTAGALTVMAVCGTALIVDHAWLVDQRDTLKTAVDAGAIAATIEMHRELIKDPRVSDAYLATTLEEVAESYIVLNLHHLSEDRLALAKSTLVVKVRPDRVAGTVDVAAQAELGGTLLARHIPLLAGVGDLGPRHAVSLIESTKVPVEVVLAIDVSTSMKQPLDRTARVAGAESRMAIVKEAAKSLVALLDPSAENDIAVGIAPWDVKVRLDDDARQRWAANGWAEYPLSRHYAMPYGHRRGTVPPSPVIQAISVDAPETWFGCLDEHRITNGVQNAGWPAIGDLGAPPGTMAFAQAFFPAYKDFVFDCAAEPLPANFRWQGCYTQVRANGGQSVFTPQYGCTENPGTALLPLTSDRTRIVDRIEALEGVGRVGTYSTLGILWAHRMLSPQWKPVWGDATHPLDSSESKVRKVIVLLTDGEDNYCGAAAGSCQNSSLGIERSEACSLAKDAGHEIFVIAAMRPSEISGQLAQALTACSSESDDPNGSYVFINIEDDADLRAAFQDIGHQLLAVRKMY